MASIIEEQEDYIKIELPRFNKKLIKLGSLPNELVNRLSLEELNNDIIHKFKYLNKKRIRRINKVFLLFFFLSVLNILFGIVIKEFKVKLILIITLGTFQIFSLPSIYFINKDHFKNTISVITYLNETYDNRRLKFQYIKKYGCKHHKNGLIYIYIMKNNYNQITPQMYKLNNINNNSLINSHYNENLPLLNNK